MIKDEHPEYELSASATTVSSAASSAPDAEALWVVDESNTILAWDERTGRVTGRIELGRPGDVRWHLEVGGNRIWAFGSDGSVALVDPAAAALLTPPKVTPRPSGGVIGMPHYAHGAMWIWGADRVWRVTDAGETSAAPAAVDDRPVGGLVLAAATDRWVFFGHGRRLLRVDPRTGSVTDESGRLHASLANVRTAAPGVLDSMVAGPDELTIAMGHNEPDIVVLDPDTIRPKRTTRVPDGSYSVTLYQDGPHVWALSETMAMRVDTHPAGEPHLIHFDWIEESSAVTTLESLWIIHRGDRALIRLHLPTSRIIGRTPIRDMPSRDPRARLVAGRRTLWLICRIDPPGDAVFRVNPATDQLLRLDQPGDLDSAHGVVATAPPTATEPPQPMLR